jgi:hypothetical protein
MTDRYERAEESSEKKAVEVAVPAPPNPTEDGPVEATSAVEVPTSLVETSPAGCNIVETATTAQPTTTQKAGTAPNANHTSRQVAEQTQQSDEPKTNSNHRKPSAPSAGGTDSTEGGGGRKSPAARPVSPKGGQRRSPRGGARRKHSPRSRGPSCRHAGMCRSPRSCYETCRLMHRMNKSTRSHSRWRMSRPSTTHLACSISWTVVVSWLAWPKTT